MMIDDASDPILGSVSRLPVITPDERRTERLRARCRARLAGHAPKPRRGYGPALIAGICLLYVSAVVHDVLRLRGLF